MLWVMLRLSRSSTISLDSPLASDGYCAISSSGSSKEKRLVFIIIFGGAFSSGNYGKSQVGIRQIRYHSSALGSFNKSLLDKVRFIKIFKLLHSLSGRYRERFGTYRSAVVTLNN